MEVPLLDLRPQYASIRAEVASALRRVIESQRFILGSEVEALEREIADFCGTAEAIGVSSGTDALLLALMAERIGPGDEVLTTPFTFFASAGVVARLGATPVFADIDPESLNLDAAGAVSRLTPRTRAIIPVHLFGRCCELDLLLATAAERGIIVIEDAAQAIGAVDARGRVAGTSGHAGCYSFFPTKNLGAFGDAGLISTADPEHAHRLRVLRVHGSEPKYHHHWIGGNFRIDALQAAVLRVKLPHLAAWTEQRRRNAGLYRALMADAGLAGIVGLPADEPGHVYHQFVVRSNRRDALRDHLARRGIGTEIYYPVPLHLQPCFQHLGYGEGDFPHAEAAAREVLALPIYPELTEAQIAYVVAAIREFYT